MMVWWAADSARVFYREGAKDVRDKARRVLRGALTSEGLRGLIGMGRVDTEGTSILHF